MEDTIAELEASLLAAPAAMPSYEAVGITAEQLTRIRGVPHGEDFIRQAIAGRIMADGKWEDRETESLQYDVARFETEESRSFFAQGLRQEGFEQPFTCWNPQMQGTWHEWLLPPAIRTARPQHLFARWPDPDQVLSPDALAKLALLGPKMRDELTRTWYGTGPIPMTTDRVACQASRIQKQLADLWLLELPPMNTLLTPEGLTAYNGLSEYYRGVFEREVSRSIREGRLAVSSHITGGIYYPTKTTFAYEVSREEFTNALREYAEHQVKQWALHAR
ncbi:MAG: hypothetical protein FJ319_01535 [SAR202 cluster bacterium]|nr:hypothetical protein [SAR202 cluster bacterium]